MCKEPDGETGCGDAEGRPEACQRDLVAPPGHVTNQMSALRHCAEPGDSLAPTWLLGAVRPVAEPPVMLPGSSAVDWQAQRRPAGETLLRLFLQRVIPGALDITETPLQPEIRVQRAATDDIHCL